MASTEKEAESDNSAGEKRKRCGPLNAKLYKLFCRYFTSHVVPSSKELIEAKFRPTYHIVKAFRLWASKMALDDSGNLVVKKTGKIILPKYKLKKVIRNLHVSPGKFRGAETVHSLLEEKRQIRSIFPNGKHHRTATVVTQLKKMHSFGRRDFGVSESYVRTVIAQCPDYPNCVDRREGKSKKGQTSAAGTEACVPLSPTSSTTVETTDTESDRAESPPPVSADQGKITPTSTVNNSGTTHVLPPMGQEIQQPKTPVLPPVGQEKHLRMKPVLPPMCQEKQLPAMTPPAAKVSIVATCGPEGQKPPPGGQKRNKPLYIQPAPPAVIGNSSMSLMLMQQLLSGISRPTTQTTTSGAPSSVNPGSQPANLGNIAQSAASPSASTATQGVNQSMPFTIFIQNQSPVSTPTQTSAAPQDVPLYAKVVQTADKEQPFKLFLYQPPGGQLNIPTLSSVPPVPAKSTASPPTTEGVAPKPKENDYPEHLDDLLDDDDVEEDAEEEEEEEGGKEVVDLIDVTDSDEEKDVVDFAFPEKSLKSPLSAHLREDLDKPEPDVMESSALLEHLTTPMIGQEHDSPRGTQTMAPTGQGAVNRNTGSISSFSVTHHCVLEGKLHTLLEQRTNNDSKFSFVRSDQDTSSVSPGFQRPPYLQHGAGTSFHVKPPGGATGARSEVIKVRKRSFPVMETPLPMMFYCQRRPSVTYDSLWNQPEDIRGQGSNYSHLVAILKDLHKDARPLLLGSRTTQEKVRKKISSAQDAITKCYGDLLSPGFGKARLSNKRKSRTMLNRLR